jgi:predicted ThiF/HesA family dinucleotide-utilizing enzyme
MEEKLRNLVSTKIKMLSDLKKSLGVEKSVFVLGNTRVKDDKMFYWTPIRRSKNFVSIGIVIFSEDEARIVLEEIDGYVDYIFVDCEKKSKNSNAVGLFNLERLSYEIITKSILKFYKGNDLTTDALDKTILSILKNSSKLVGGCNILIVGMGNLGFKISLKLVERGANVYVLNRNAEKAIKLIETINLIKPPETLASAKFINNFDVDFNFDIIVLTHIDTIPENDHIYLKTNKECFFIDVGKGCLTKNQINQLVKNENICLRLDVGDSLLEYIYTEIIFDGTKTNFIPTQKILENRRIISTGLIGGKDDIVVDDAENPSFFYGICDGSGGFKQYLSEEDKKFINTIISPKVNE